MDGTTALAIYGAALSTAIAGTEGVKWFLQQKTRLRIEVQEGFNFSTRGKARWAVLEIHVINDGERDEQITSVYLDRLNSKGGWDPDNGVLPDDTVRPRQRISYGAIEQDLAEEGADIDLSYLKEAYRIRVTTGRGQEFVSSTQPPLSAKDLGA